MRYLPLSDHDREVMLKRIGVPSVDSLFSDVPKPAYLTEPVDLPKHQGEIEVERAIAAMAAKNLGTQRAAASFLGGGAYRHHIPASVDALIQRGEFLTSYTPYQPEISQGTLQYLFEFQTQVALITGMEIANASMYDGATAAVEAVMMANRVTRRNRALLSGGLHPQYAEVIRTYGHWTGFSVTDANPDILGREDLLPEITADLSCVVVQNPSFFGPVRDLHRLAEACHAKGVLLIVVVTEAVSLGLLQDPGSMGADIVAAEGQSIGNSLSFGGPYVGLFATREKFLRQMPGRIAGETVDEGGRRGWVLTLSTREQHIRREKATSNICTNSGLCALAFTIHMTLLGEAGFTRLARLNHARAVELADRVTMLKGAQLLTDAFFNEITLDLGQPAAPVVEALAKKGVLGGIPLSRFYPDREEMRPLLLLCVTEMNSSDDIEQLMQGLKEVL